MLVTGRSLVNEAQHSQWGHVKHIMLGQKPSTDKMSFCGDLQIETTGEIQSKITGAI